LVIAEAVEGRTDRALSFLPALERQAESLDSPRTWALFEHASGVTSLAIGRTGPAIDSLDRSIARFRNLGLVPDMARAVLGRGRARARAGFRSQAIADLKEATRLFSAIGATRWAAQAEREIARVGPAQAEGPLTATESQIAGLVTDGRKNKEIAAELFVSVATVEAHLTRVYRKLGISSRAELARLVADGTLAIPREIGETL
jgi:DNA-binding CsgD family transcriptional regulator